MKFLIDRVTGNALKHSLGSRRRAREFGALEQGVVRKGALVIGHIAGRDERDVHRIQHELERGSVHQATLSSLPSMVTVRSFGHSEAQWIVAPGGL